VACDVTDAHRWLTIVPSDSEGEDMRTVPPLLLMFAWSATAFASGETATDPSPPLLHGRFDNVEQAKVSGSAVPKVTVEIEPTAERGWTLWHVHIRTDPESSFDQTWAMQFRKEHDGSGALIPYYQLKQTGQPAAATFDPNGWLSLEACALRGAIGADRMEGIAEGEPCVAVTMSVGARRALLPVGFTLDREWLRLDMNLRGVRTRIDAKRN
jgi:hypothetical protein